MKTAALILCVVVAIVMAFRNPTDIDVNFIYPIEFTVDNREIILNPFPYDIPRISLTVPTTGHRCAWLINGTKNSRYPHNYTYILLKPFGMKFARTNVCCIVLETRMYYNLSIGNMCPCKICGGWVGGRVGGEGEERGDGKEEEEEEGGREGRREGAREEGREGGRR